MAEFAELGRARERCGTGADARHARRVRTETGNGKRRATTVKVLHRVALQTADFDRLPIILMHHARTFAQYIDGADAGAACAQDVGVQNRNGGAAQIAARDLLDKSRYVDMRRASAGARSVEAEKTAIRFD